MFCILLIKISSLQCLSIAISLSKIHYRNLYKQRDKHLSAQRFLESQKRATKSTYSNLKASPPLSSILIEVRTHLVVIVGILTYFDHHHHLLEIKYPFFATDMCFDNARSLQSRLSRAIATTYSKRAVSFYYIKFAKQISRVDNEDHTGHEMWRQVSSSILNFWEMLFVKPWWHYPFKFAKSFI